MTTQFDKLALLVKAILTRVREREGYVTKTKLFKYLYLIDVEWYRHKECLFTGFQWIFYHYGPWSQDCENLYAQLKSTDDIQTKPGTRSDLETEFVQTSEPVDLDKALDDFLMESIIRNIVDTWADRRLGDMLDYVYFRTEPMESAERGKSLDFSKIEGKIKPTSFTTQLLSTKSSKQEAVERMRKNIEGRKQVQPLRQPVFTEPLYDDLYSEVVSSMKEDDE